MSDSPARVLRQLTSGVYVIGVAHEGRRNAFTAAWLIQASFEPLLLALSVNREHASYPLLTAGPAFSVNVLRRDQLDLARHFGTQSGREVDKLATVEWRPGPAGAPVLTQAHAYLECRPGARLLAGDHEIILGHVIGGGLLATGGSPLAYADTGDMDGSEALFPPSF